MSAGEEGIMIGSSAALGPDDIITCQYRETGVFLQRGFQLKDFMSQLFANMNDPGKGRNMPCHYSGKLIAGVVCDSNFNSVSTNANSDRSTQLHRHLALKFHMPQALLTL